jgi:hypothetical protein
MEPRTSKVEGRYVRKMKAPVSKADMPAGFEPIPLRNGKLIHTANPMTYKLCAERYDPLIGCQRVPAACQAWAESGALTPRYPQIF